MLVANPTSDITLQMDSENYVKMIYTTDPNSYYYFETETDAVEKCSANRGVISDRYDNILECSTDYLPDQVPDETINDRFNIFPWLIIGMFFGLIYIIFMRYRSYQKHLKERRGDFRT